MERGYLFSSQLRDLEQYTRMYYDLSINIEGIEAIHHMLKPDAEFCRRRYNR